MLHFGLQTHSCGKRLSLHPYLNKAASKNTHLVNEDFHVLMVKMITILKHRLMLLYHWLLIVLVACCFEGFSDRCHKISLKI